MTFSCGGWDSWFAGGSRSGIYSSAIGPNPKALAPGILKWTDGSSVRRLTDMHSPPALSQTACVMPRATQQREVHSGDGESPTTACLSNACQRTRDKQGTASGRLLGTRYMSGE
jgi:hypothetical protein